MLVFQATDLANRFWGAARLKAIPVAEGNLYPDHTRTHQPDDDAELREALLDYWSSQPLPDWRKRGKVEAPRIILACLFERKRIREVNDYLCKQKPAGVTGSTWKLNPHGDYDFTLMALTPLLYFFGNKPGLLYPKTLKHLVNTLLISHGGSFQRAVPGTAGLVEDTENHLLMTNGSYYLKNRWLRLHGHRERKYDNTRNGLQRKLLDYLLEIYHCGLYEFNSAPYEGYTLSALLNLQGFAGDSVQLMAERILDRLNWEYAFGSWHFKRFPPFRRRYDRAGRTNLQGDYQGAMMKTWVSFYNDSLELSVKRGKHQALWAAVMPYRPPDRVVNLVCDKKKPYYVKMGHGWNSSPEIYSGGRYYFLSAGGVNRGKRSMIIARPVILMTDPDADNLQDAFHVAGPGKTFMDWNNTGVYKDFACAAGPVFVPAGKKPVLEEQGWRIFSITEELYVAVYSTSRVGIMAISHTSDPIRLLHKILLQNPDQKKLMTQFHHPDGDMIEYDLHSPHDKWVIAAVNHKPVNRDFDRWPLFDIGNW